MRITLTTLALVVYTEAMQLTSDLDQSDNALRFGNWAAKQNRSYKSMTERDKRFAEWLLKDKDYKEINRDPSNTFLVGHNNFSDWTEAEFKAILLKDEITTLSEQSFAEILRQNGKLAPGGNVTGCASCSKCGTGCGC